MPSPSRFIRIILFTSVFLVVFNPKLAVLVAVGTKIVNYHRNKDINNTARTSWRSYALSRPSPFGISPVTRLPVLADGASAMPSNANNFHGEMNASVDPRTGSARYTITLASMLYNLGQARRELTLSYVSGSSATGPNSLNLGSHWTFNIGLEHPSISEISGHQTTDITMSDGHGFTMESDKNALGNTIWHPLRHKLGDVNITGEPGDWTIATASGIRQHIQFGYEDWEEGRDEQRVWFYYDRHGPQDISRRLIYICGHPLTQNQLTGNKNNCSENGIYITYQGDEITIHGQQNIVLHMTDTEGQSIVKSIVMPSLSSNNTGADQSDSEIDFNYDEKGGRPWLLKTIIGSSGASSTFLYNDEASHTLQPKGLPTGYNKAFLPVVTELTVTPSSVNNLSIPVRHIWYQYSRGTSSPHNFTGYLSGVSNEPGKDNLFDRSDDYTYAVMQDNGLTTTKTTYNKYHLPLDISQNDDLRHSLIASDDITYLPWKGTTFNKLPPVYSFPLQTTKTLYSLTSEGNDTTITPAKVLQQKKYNDNGQVIWQQDAYGRQIFTQYCPPLGDSHCPKTDPDWPQVTLPEKVLQLPAKQTPAGSIPFLTFPVTNEASSAVEVEFNYQLIPIAQRNKKRIALYQRLLHRRWVQTKTSEAIRHDANLLSLYSHKHFIHQIGQDNSPLAGNWQVATKVTGTLPATSVAGLQPGQPLPELTKSQLSTTTNYQYNLQQDSTFYGLLTRISVTRYQQPDPIINGRLLQVNRADSLIKDNGHPETIMLDVTHNIDLATRTRTTTLKVDPTLPPTNISHAYQLLNADNTSHDSNGLPLGQSTYSLSSGLKLSSDDTMKTLHTQWVYDNWQRPIKKIITPEEGGQPQSVSWAYISTDKEQSVVKTLPNGVQQKIIYAGIGRNQKVMSVWIRPKSMATQPMIGINEWIPASSITYTATDKPASKTVYHATDNDGSTIALTTSYGYDALNRPVWTKTPDGIISIHLVDDPQLLLINYQVATGNNNQQEKLAPILSVVQSNTIGKPVARYSFALDPQAKIKGRFIYSDTLKATLIALKSQLRPANSLKTLQSYGLLPLSGKTGLFAFINAAISAKSWLSEMTMQYDGNGRQISQIAPDGAKTQWKWQNGNLVATITPNGSIIHDTFDIRGNKISRCVQPAHQSSCHVLGTRHYDRTGNLQWQADEYHKRIYYTYDADGRLLSMKTPATKDSPEGHVFTYTYNSFAKTGEAIDGVVYATWHWNPKTWNLTDAEDTISHLHYDYDPNTGQVIKITRSAPVTLKSPTGIHYPQGSSLISYDRYGHVISFLDFTGNKYTSVHDRFGRVLQTNVVLHGKSKKIPLSTTTYDNLFGRVLSITNGMGIVRIFQYDNLGQVISTTDKYANTLLQKLSYSYDPETHNITSFTRTEGKESALYSYTYDKNTNSLTGVHCGVTGQPDKASTLCPRDTDLSGSTLISAPIITDQQYTFDDWNNIKTVNEKLITVRGNKTGKVTNYTYARQITGNYDPHRMIAFSSRWQTNSSTFSAVPKAISYDTLGRVVKDADGNSIHYNGFGQQDKFTNTKTGGYATYTYDANGHQIAEQPFDAKGKPLQQPLYMTYQGDTITGQTQKDAGGITHTTAELAGIAHSEDGDITQWYLHDYKGDLISTFNSAGKRTSDHVYSPYGMDNNLLSNSDQRLQGKLTLSSQTPWWQNHLPGFDDQMNDPVTGYQFLGGGYRAYNPIYRHFMSHDSYSPFTKINGYGFADNNPVMNTDPSGHLPQWLGYALGCLGVTMAIASAVVLPVVTAGYASVVAITSATLASMTLAPIGVATGALQIAGTAYPENKSLAITNESFGLASGLTTMYMAGGIIIAGSKSVLTSIEYAIKVFTISSGINSGFSGVTSEAMSGMDIAATANPNLSYKSGFSHTAKVIGYASMGLMVASVISSIGAGMLSSISLGRKNGMNIAREQEITNSDEFTPLLPYNSSADDQEGSLEMEQVYRQQDSEKPFTRAVIGCGRQSIMGSCSHPDGNILTFSLSWKKNPHIRGAFEEFAELGSFDGKFEEISLETPLFSKRQLNAALRMLKSGGSIYVKTNMEFHDFDFRPLATKLNFAFENVTKNAETETKYNTTFKPVSRKAFFSNNSDHNWKITKL